MKSKLTYEKAHKLFRYDPKTGKLYWRVSRRGGRCGSSGVMPGDECGCVIHDCRNKYRVITTGGRQYKTHRIIWLMIYGEWPKNQIDHIDGNGLNNKIKNLRDVNCSENSKNRRKSNVNRSGVTGVFWLRSAKKWRATIGCDGKNMFVGNFANKDDAESAYKIEAKRLGFSDRHGREL